MEEYGRSNLREQWSGGSGAQPKDVVRDSMVAPVGPTRVGKDYKVVAQSKLPPNFAATKIPLSYFPPRPLQQKIVCSSLTTLSSTMLLCTCKQCFSSTNTTLMKSTIAHLNFTIAKKIETFAISCIVSGEKNK
jgi:hypothetical protein